MALINAESYGELAKSSSGGSNRSAGKFFPVFISGVAREGQEYEKLHCMTKIDGGEYLIQNASTVYMIAYFVKRYWEKYVKTKNQKGEDYEKLVAFGWGDDVAKMDDSCKYAYTIAGLLLDPVTKKAVTHKKDIPDAEIKAGDPVLIHFKCSGMKFQGGMNFLKALDDKAKNLPPISNSPEFEKKVIYPKRFITAVTVSHEDSAYGRKPVYSLVPEINLPEKAIEQVVKSADGLLAFFNKQFDKSGVNSGAKPGSQGSTDSGIDPNDNLRFDTPSAPATEASPAEDKNFDLGI